MAFLTMPAMTSKWLAGLACHERRAMETARSDLPRRPRRLVPTGELRIMDGRLEQRFKVRVYQRFRLGGVFRLAGGPRAETRLRSHHRQVIGPARWNQGATVRRHPCEMAKATSSHPKSKRV